MNAADAAVNGNGRHPGPLAGKKFTRAERARFKRFLKETGGDRGRLLAEIRKVRPEASPDTVGRFILRHAPLFRVHQWGAKTKTAPPPKAESPRTVAVVVGEARFTADRKTAVAILELLAGV